jgi:aminopeptidase N
MDNWSDFWLNEGFATFIERQVSASLYGGEFARAEAVVGNNSVAADFSNS